MMWHVVRTMDGKQMEYLRSLHETYGDVVRVGEFAVFRSRSFAIQP